MLSAALKIGFFFRQKADRLSLDMNRQHVKCNPSS